MKPVLSRSLVNFRVIRDALVIDLLAGPGSDGKDAREIDLLLEQNGKLFPIEIKKMAAPPKKLTKVFDMESTDERLDLRHGLGLLLVMQIVKAHGGTTEIESAPQNWLTCRWQFVRHTP